MSYITNVLLCVPLIEFPGETDEHPAVNKLQQLFGEHKLTRVDVVGPKCLEIAVWAAAVNGFDHKAAVELLCAWPWLDRDNIQFLVKDQDDESFWDALHPDGPI